AYANALPNGLVWDDPLQVLTEPPEHIDIVDIFTRPSWQNLGGRNDATLDEIRTFRPLLLLTFLFNAAIWGPRIWGHHVTSVALFSPLAMLLLAVTRRWTRAVKDAPPGVAPLVFSLLVCTQPFLTESVSWLSGLHDVLAAVFLGLSMLLLIGGAESSGGRRV